MNNSYLHLSVLALLYISIFSCSKSGPSKDFDLPGLWIGEMSIDKKFLREGKLLEGEGVEIKEDFVKDLFGANMEIEFQTNGLAYGAIFGMTSSGAYKLHLEDAKVELMMDGQMIF